MVQSDHEHPFFGRLFSSARALWVLCALGLLFLGTANDAFADPPAPHAHGGEASPPPPARERTEYWSGKILSATFRATMCRRPDGALRGVFLLTHKNGSTDSYHVFGRVEGNSFEARHGSGHVISGDLGNPGEVSGRMRLKNGMSFKFKSPRTYDVPVTDDCAPTDWRP